jgi:hypothetical protein
MREGPSIFSHWQEIARETAFPSVTAQLRTLRSSGFLHNSCSEIFAVIHRELPKLIGDAASAGARWRGTRYRTRCGNGLYIHRPDASDWRNGRSGFTPDTTRRMSGINPDEALVEFRAFSGEFRATPFGIVALEMDASPLTQKARRELRCHRRRDARD